MGVTEPRHLVDRHPSLDAAALTARFHPPRRFDTTTFESFVPSPPSQAALDAMRALAETPPPRTRRRPPPGRGLYLDGGFGVGKTHLLAAAWHAGPAPKAYLTFTELTATIGFLGMAAAVEAFAGYRLLCIDEFELDDVANTLMTVTFLRSIMPAGVRVATTSNSLPERLGEGRFSAEDFQREIAAIAAWFDVVRIDGPDYRPTLPPPGPPAPGDGIVTDDTFAAVLAHLRVVHPVQYGALLDGLDGVVIRGLRTVTDQSDALRWVALVDKLYDSAVRFGATGTFAFDESFRHGGYRKKYGRCESRLAAMLGP